MLSLLKDKVFYGWVVIIAGLMINGISFTMRSSFGVFFKSIEGEFDLTRGATSSIFSVHMLLCCVITVFGGWALDRYGPRVVVFLMGSFTGLSLLLTSQTNSAWQLFISYSLLFSLGTGALYTVVNSTVSRWFDKKRGLALGLATSGGALGTVIMAPFATYLISSFDWRAALIVIGLITWLVVLPLSRLLRREPSDIGLLPDGVKPEAAKARLQNKENNTRPTGFSLLQASRTSNFWFLGFIWLFGSISQHLVTTHIVPHAIDVGISPMDAAVILSLMGAGAIPGRLVTGMVSDINGRRAPAITCALLQVGTLISLIWIEDLWMFYLFAVVFGFSWAGLAIMVAALIGDIFGMRSIGAIMGALVVGWTFGGAIGPAMGGFIFDVSASYSMAFAMAAVTMLIATLLAALIKRQMSTESS